MNRSKVAVLNSGLSLTTQILTYILQFIYRTVLVYVLGVEYSGITGLCQNVIGLFALSELGMSWAIAYYLYKPLKENDNEIVAAIIYFLKRLYRWVGLFILIGGLCVIPFLNNIIKGGEEIEHLQWIFALYVFNSAFSYLFFSYYQTLATSDRKNYVLFLPQTCGNIGMVVLQIAAIYLFHSFISAVSISVISTLAINIVIRNKVIKLYPFLKTYKKSLIAPELKSKIVKYMKSTMLYKVSLTVQTSSTSVIISYFIGIVVLGVYANYTLIVDTIRSLILSLINPMTAVIGEVTTNTSPQEKEAIYKRLNFLMEWISYFCAICLYCLLTPFVTLWVGIELTLPFTTIVIICLYFYIEFIISFSTLFRTACGLNNIGKFRPLLTAILNVVLAILLVKHIGLNGILLALLLSRITTLTWFEPWIVHKYVLKKSVKRYYLSMIYNFLFTVAVALGMKYIVETIWNGTTTSFILSFIICLIIPTVIFVIAKFHTAEFQYYLTKLKSSLVSHKQK